jgi:hypothetical protein
MPDEIVIEDDPTTNDDQRYADRSVQNTPPEEPAARAAYFEAKFNEEALSKREALSDLKRTQGIVEDERTSKKYWEEQAKGRTAGPADDPQKEAAVDDAIEPFDLAELTVAEDGGQQLVQKIKKALGGVTAADIEAAIDRRLNTIVANGRLGEKYEELADPESEFTKKVNSRTVQLAKDPECEGMSQIALMRLAAAEVTSENGGRKTSGNREARIGRQSVQGGAPRQNGKQSTELNDQQRKFARIAGITDAEYAKEANEGIRTYPTLGSQ